MGLGGTIKDKNKACTQDYAKALILRHHLDEGLKIEYLIVKDPLILWNGLKERYDNLKLVTLPQERYNWAHFRLQVFKSVSEYNSAIVRITSKLKLYGDSITDYDMIKKTQRFMPPIWSCNNSTERKVSRNKNNHQKWKGKDEKPKAKGSETECFRCGRKCHWANICRTLNYLVELYQASLKNKGPEANFVYDNEFDIIHLDVADFFKHPDGKIDHLIGDGSLVKDD
ncbi:uncharacterized protein [Nicotiana tomentosiformis]|uniref:uncharacterized protein n=1 Tax=Nicotiana tomentosiformis TaxID=4098 RepID=UPI00388C81C1